MFAGPEITNRDDALTVLADFIVSGRFEPGDRLPPERDLIVRLGLTRARLRQALEALEREGKIWRHVGKGTSSRPRERNGCRNSAAR